MTSHSPDRDPGAMAASLSTGWLVYHHICSLYPG